MAIIDYLKTLFSGKSFVRFFLACVWSAFAMFVVAYLITHDMQGSAKEYGNTVLGFIFGVITAITGFYFGSSQSSADKDETIKKAAETKAGV